MDNTLIPHRPRIPTVGIAKYLDSWLKRTQFAKILTEFAQSVDVGLSGIRLKSFELFKTLATNSPNTKIVIDSYQIPYAFLDTVTES